VTDVIGSAPLVSSGGTKPNISLPNVIIEATNTAIGSSALFNNTGDKNAAVGAGALFRQHHRLLQHRQRGQCAPEQLHRFFNTASGFSALELNTTGGANTSSGYFALESNTTGGNNTATGSVRSPTTRPDLRIPR